VAIGSTRIPYLLGHREIARIFGVAPDTPQLWRKRSLLGAPDLVISGNPYWLLPTVLTLAKPGYRDVDQERLAEYKAEIQNGYSVPTLRQPPPLIGIKEIAWIFGRTHSDIGQWRNRGTLPAADLTLSGTPLWLLNTILEDATRRGRATFPEAIGRIREGERARPKPRGRSQATVEDSSEPDLSERIFSSSERSEAITFVMQIMKAGYAIKVQSLPQDGPPQVADQ
jgi:hypothetical protein